LIVAYIDGGARGNPGPAGFGVRIEDEQGTLIDEISEPIGRATNNVAEYRGLLAALEWAKRGGHRRLHVRSDSQLLVHQMHGSYKVRNPGLQPLYAEARRLIADIGRVTFEHVPREQNAHADRLANMAMDGKPVERNTAQAVPAPPYGGNDAGVAGVVLKPSPPAAADPFTPSERAVRLFVYRHFVETGRAPDIGSIAAAVSLDHPAVIAALRRLVAAHALVMAPASTHIWMAHPFSAVPTAYPVAARGRSYWANCAWDAAGIMALLDGGETRTRCPECGDALAIAVHDGRISGGGVVHFAVPPHRFWDNIAYT
jgi:ribonuclease HI